MQHPSQTLSKFCLNIMHPRIKLCIEDQGKKKKEEVSEKIT